jgi:hypothetical protein
MFPPVPIVAQSVPFIVAYATPPLVIALPLVFAVLVLMFAPPVGAKFTVPPKFRVNAPKVTFMLNAPFCATVTFDAPALIVVPLNTCKFVCPLFPFTSNVPPPSTSAEVLLVMFDCVIADEKSSSSVPLLIVVAPV